MISSGKYKRGEEVGKRQEGGEIERMTSAASCR